MNDASASYGQEIEGKSAAGEGGIMRIFRIQALSSWMLPAILVLSSGINAQNISQGGITVPYSSAPVKGYIITKTWDTIPGTLQLSRKYVENNPVEVSFTGKQGTRLINAKDLRGLIVEVRVTGREDPDSYPDGLDYFVTLPSIKRGTPVFYNRLLKGKLSIYLDRNAMISKSSASAYPERMEGIRVTYARSEGLYLGPDLMADHRFFERITGYSDFYVTKGSSRLVKVDKTNYKTMFRLLFNDCQALSDEITKNPDLAKFSNFPLLATIYNQLCSD